MNDAVIKAEWRIERPAEFERVVMGPLSQLACEASYVSAGLDVRLTHRLQDGQRTDVLANFSSYSLLDTCPLPLPLPPFVGVSMVFALGLFIRCDLPSLLRVAVFCLSFSFPSLLLLVLELTAPAS